MKRIFSLGLLTALMLFAGKVWAQASGNAPYGLDMGQAPFFQVTGQYQATKANAPPGQCGCFWMQGGGVELNVAVRPRWSGMADLYYASNNKIGNTDEQLHIFNYLVGPRYSYRMSGRYTPYGQVLGGISHVGSNYSIYSAGSNSLAFEAGLGVEFYLRPKISVTPIEADWVASHALNGVNTRQNNLRVGFGVTYRMGPRYGGKRGAVCG